MDDDVASLHGVAASDSGYTTSSASRAHARRKKGSHSTAKSSASTAGTSTGSLNARFDRLSREMEEVAEATSNGSADGAGRSLGIKRKKIAHRAPEHVELGGIEGRAAWAGRAEQVQEEEPKLKRRRSLAPRQPPVRRRGSSDVRGAAEDEQEEEPPLWLKRIISPDSGQKRTVAIVHEQADPQDTPSYLGEPMEMPSFMREKQSDPLPSQRFSPRPDWLTHYLAGTPAPTQLPTVAMPLPARPVGGAFTPAPSASSSLPLPPFEDDFYEPPPSPAAAFSAAMYPPQQQQYQLQPVPHTPLPFSTSGRLARPASQAALFASNPQEALYESQLARTQFQHAGEEATPGSRYASSAQPAYLARQAATPDAFTQYPFSTSFHTTLAPSPAFSRSPAWTAEPAFQQQQHMPRLDYAYDPAYSNNGGRVSRSPQLFPFPSSSSHDLFPQPFSPIAAYDESPYPAFPTEGGASVYVAAKALEPNIPASSSFWRRPEVPRLTATEQGQKPTLQPGQLRFARRLEEEAASQIARNGNKASEVGDVRLRPRQDEDASSLRPTSALKRNNPSSPFFILRTPPPPQQRPSPSPSLSLLAPPTRASSRVLPIENKDEDENRLPSPSLYRYLPGYGGGGNGEGTPRMQEKQEKGGGREEAPRLGKSRTAQSREENGEGRGREKTPSTRGSPLAVLVEGVQQRVVEEEEADGGVEGDKEVEEQGEEEGVEEEVVRFDWDVVGEGGRLLEALREEGKEEEEEGGGRGHDAFDFYEDPEDPVEE